MQMLMISNVILRFLLELFGIVTIIYCGFKSNHLLTKLGVGAALPLIIIILWAMFGAPGSKYELSVFLHLLLELIVFGLPAVVLYFSGYKSMSMVYLIFVVGNRLLMYVWDQ